MLGETVDFMAKHDPPGYEGDSIFDYIWGGVEGEFIGDGTNYGVRVTYTYRTGTFQSVRWEEQSVETRVGVLVALDIGTITEDELPLYINPTGLLNARDVYKPEADEWSMNTGLPGQGDGPQDAVRHAYFSALCANDPLIGIAGSILIGKAHEVSWPNSEVQHAMDMYNNEKGANVIDGAVLPLPYSTIQSEVLNLLNSGKLRQRNSTADFFLVPSTSTYPTNY